ncbi:MAG: hypothetical protein AAF567_03945 [Actinomycetota bacterium]
MGLDQATIDAVADWRATTDLTEIEKLVVEFAETLTSNPVTVSDDLQARMQAAFSTKQIVELTNFIAWENARARFNRAFGIEAEGYDRPVISG